MLDVLIIGAGTAGLTAAIYAARAGLAVEVVEETIYGGQIITTTSIENYPGMPGISGADFANALYSQAQELGVSIRFDTIEGIQLAKTPKTAVLKHGVLEAKCVILCTGAKPRKLECPGEMEFTGRGVSYCATCDGAFHKGGEVAVIGGGNTALEDALVLSGLCSKVWLVHRTEQFRAENHTLKQARSRDNIVFLTNCEAAEIRGGKTVEQLLLKGPGAPKTGLLPVSGVFIAVGALPNSSLFTNQITLDKTGYVMAGENCQTNLSGVFAAGDLRTKTVRQIVTAAADGAVSALGAVEYIAGLQ